MVKSLLCNEDPNSHPGKQGSMVSNARQSTIIIYFSLAPSVISQFLPTAKVAKVHCFYTKLFVSLKTTKCLKNLTISFWPPYYLKRSTVPFTQAFLQQIYKVTSASETDVYARILFCSLMLFRLTSNYLTH